MSASTSCLCMPIAKQAAVATTIAISGIVNWYLRFDAVALRQAISGPTPVRNSSVSPIGTIHRLKNGADTVMRSWNSASDSVGNIVANSMKNAANSRIQLLSRNAASRDSHESSRARDRSSGMR